MSAKVVMMSEGIGYVRFSAEQLHKVLSSQSDGNFEED